MDWSLSQLSPKTFAPVSSPSQKTIQQVLPNCGLTQDTLTLRFGSSQEPEEKPPAIDWAAQIEDVKANIDGEPGAEKAGEILDAWAATNYDMRHFASLVFLRLLEAGVLEENIAAASVCQFLEDKIQTVFDLDNFDPDQYDGSAKPLLEHWQKADPETRAHMLPSLYKAFGEGRDEDEWRVKIFIKDNQAEVDQALNSRLNTLYNFSNKLEEAGQGSDFRELMYDLLGPMAGPGVVPMVEMLWHMETNEAHAFNLATSVFKMIEREVPGAEELRVNIQPDLDKIILKGVKAELEENNQADPKFRWSFIGCQAVRAARYGSPELVGQVFGLAKTNPWKTPGYQQDFLNELDRGLKDRGDWSKFDETYPLRQAWEQLKIDTAPIKAAKKTRTKKKVD